MQPMHTSQNNENSFGEGTYTDVSNKPLRKTRVVRGQISKSAKTQKVSSEMLTEGNISDTRELYSDEHAIDLFGADNTTDNPKKSSDSEKREKFSKPIEAGSMSDENIPDENISLASDIYIDEDYVDRLETTYVSSNSMPQDICLEITEQKIFSQIAKQIAKMSTTVLSHKLKEYAMKYEIGVQYHEAKIVRMQMDGGCLFRALEHQLSCEHPESVSYEENVILLRKDVVAHIKANRNEYMLQIRNSVYDIDDIENEDAACDKLLDQLSNPSFWGGSETMKAVSKMKKVNILIVNENGGVFYFSFDPEFDNRIIVAYRLPAKVGRKSKNKAARNHYDSLTDLKQEDVFQLAEIIFGRMYNDQDKSIALEISHIQ